MGASVPAYSHHWSGAMKPAADTGDVGIVGVGDAGAVGTGVVALAT